MTDTSTIARGTRLRIWPGAKEGPGRLATALAEPRVIPNFSSDPVVRIIRDDDGGTDYLAVTHVEVVTGEAALPTLPEARESREQAIVQVADHAEADWVQAAYDAVRDLATSQDRITADEVWDYLAREHSDLTPHEPRAMGAVMRRAVKDGLVELAGCGVCGTKKVMVTGRSRQSNAGDVPVYRAVRKVAEDHDDPQAQAALRAAAQAQADYLATQDARPRAIQAAVDAGNGYRDIAQAMGLSVGNVYSLRKRT